MWASKQSVAKRIAKLVVILLSVYVCYFVYEAIAYGPLILANIPSDARIDAYGRDKFVKQALEFETVGRINTELNDYFHPKRMMTFSCGVLLIFAENKKYVKGLYVESQPVFESGGGSGMYTTYRSKHIGVTEAKKRRLPVGTNLKGLGIPPVTDSNEI